ncbi:hypothetical protein AA21291_1745 [Swaminathania salitolerans LMG 21291]|uniref:Uncharacterized protein n=2 Tax=Swaminathania salitolerans TaxID=182838 RepID=A0A511BRH2_9PROT|nr:hypothetical protein AA21291_1745 [Swaminathania salitolerans LMG 21291]GEL02937.1 hypothetical protein SSA02_21000 [Swaminathania salitolerans]
MQDAQGARETPVAPLVLDGHGEKILSQIARPDGSLALHIAGPESDRIVIWNPERHEIVARFSLRK